MFKYGRGVKSTKVADGAGKHAVFNEKFTLNNVNVEVENDSTLVLDALEKDVTTSEHLGSIAPITWSDICRFEGTLKHDVDIVGKGGQKAGNIIFKTQLLWEEYVPPQASS